MSGPADKGEGRVPRADREAEAAVAFGEAFRAEQAANYGCAGEIECAFPMGGNCWCFNRTLARHRDESTPELVEALEPFEREFRDAGIGLHLSDDQLMLDVDPGGEILTVGHWRRLMAALTKSRGQS
jgi:hypothetical protein